MYMYMKIIYFYNWQTCMRLYIYIEICYIFPKVKYNSECS